jgi:hypothetical protein
MMIKLGPRQQEFSLIAFLGALWYAALLLSHEGTVSWLSLARVIMRDGLHVALAFRPNCPRLFGIFMFVFVFLLDSCCHVQQAYMKEPSKRFQYSPCAIYVFLAHIVD